MPLLGRRPAAGLLAADGATLLARGLLLELSTLHPTALHPGTLRRCLLAGLLLTLLTGLLETLLTGVLLTMLTGGALLAGRLLTLLSGLLLLVALLTVLGLPLLLAVLPLWLAVLPLRLPVLSLGLAGGCLSVLARWGLLALLALLVPSRRVHRELALLRGRRRWRRRRWSTPYGLPSVLVRSTTLLLPFWVIRIHGYLSAMCAVTRQAGMRPVVDKIYHTG